MIALLHLGPDAAAALVSALISATWEGAGSGCLRLGLPAPYAGASARGRARQCG